MIVVIALLVLVSAAVVTSRHWMLNEYAITPGNATPVEPLVHVSGLATRSHHDQIMLTDVYLEQLSAWQYFLDHFERHVQFVTAAQLLDPGVPSSELGPQGYLEMSDSKTDAQVAALSALGWKLKATPIGTLVTGVASPSPAWSAHVKVADRIVAFDGTPVRSTCALVADVHGLEPRTAVTLGIDKAHISGGGTITWGPATTVSLRTSKLPTGLGSSGCAGVSGANHSWLGVSLEDATSYVFPARVTIDTKDIGGPSAGLAMTLSIIDELSRHSLTHGVKIAATGTIDQHGNVGDVGGVAEKTVAVQRAGAKYFLVPKVEVATATANAAPGLRIIGVSTLDQALHALERIGGAKPVAITKPRSLARGT